MTNYFSHDYDAQSDIKLQTLVMKMDYAALGRYWCMVEMLYKQGGRIKLEQCESIAFALHTECKIIEQIISLVFEKDDKYFWSETILRRLKIQKEISKKRSGAAKKKWENEAKNKDANAGKGALHDAEQAQSKSNAIKEKKSKGNKKKENNNPQTPKGELSVFLESFNEKFGTNYQETEGRKRKLELRRKKFSVEQIASALANLALSDFHRGKNDRGWHADPDFFLRSDEQIDKWLNLDPEGKEELPPEVQDRMRDGAFVVS